MLHSLSTLIKHFQLIFDKNVAIPFIIFFLLYFTLQYCIGFAIHQYESATGVHVLRRRQEALLVTQW